MEPTDLEIDDGVNVVFAKPEHPKPLDMLQLAATRNSIANHKLSRQLA